jgi:molecular chaperone GrpE
MSSKHQETRPEAHDNDTESPETVADGLGQVDRAASLEAEAVPPMKESKADEKTAARVAELEKELSGLREELSAVNDKYLRKLADDVNFRKRMAREKEDAQRYALTGLLGDLIPVLDDFDRAIASAETQRDYGVLHDGIGLIRRQLGSVLESKYGLVRYESQGKPFDPNRHEAVAMVQGVPEDGDEAVVAEEFLPGYGLHERILRTAKVRVRMPAPRGAAPDPASGEVAADKEEN